MTRPRRAKDMLQSCGTDLQHFYDAVGNEKLKLSFRDIAMKLATPFLAKGGGDLLCEPPPKTKRAP